MPFILILGAIESFVAAEITGPTEKLALKILAIPDVVVLNPGEAGLALIDEVTQRSCLLSLPTEIHLRMVTSDGQSSMDESSGRAAEHVTMGLRSVARIPARLSAGADFRQEPRRALFAGCLICARKNCKPPSCWAM